MVWPSGVIDSIGTDVARRRAAAAVPPARCRRRRRRRGPRRRADVDGPVAGERDRRAGGRELAVGQLAGGSVDGIGAEAHADRDAGRVGHLRRQRALPDHPVQRQVLTVELAADLRGSAVRGGRADRLVGLLRVLHLRRVLLRRWAQVLLAVLARDRGASRLHRLVGQHDVVGTHVGDVAPLVQALGDAHHLRRRHPQLAAALLLQGRGHERRLRRRCGTASPRPSGP